MRIIRIDEKDNTAVALQRVKQGEELDYGITAVDEIPAGHKIALCEIPKNSEVIKYGAIIGRATKNIGVGEHIHTHNMKTRLGGKDEYEYKREIDFKERELPKTHSFMGFRRSNGKVGVRNDIWIIPTVGCVNGVAKSLEKIGREIMKGSVSEVTAFIHPYGCSQLGGDKENTEKILADLINHPNAGGVLVVGLGCENSGIDELKKYIEKDPNRVRFLQTQDFDDEIREGKELLSVLIEAASAEERTEIPVSELTIGLKCGGSDGLSGITANPAVGVFTDILVTAGGTAILTEVPEMFGAERLLMNRAANYEIFSDTVKLINDFKDYFEKAGVPVYENPSPGNKAGGISTLEDKSLGCTQKSGSAEVCGVIEYGGVVKAKGLNLLSAPGNDLVASTALAAAGAHIVLFTTGRGTPFGCPVPTVKISSNTALAEKKKNWLDFNAGVVAEGSDIQQTGYELFELVVKTASGSLAKNEKMGYKEIAIFKTGVTL